MDRLGDNLYNKRRSRDESKLKMWRYCGLMLTYRCNASCAFCYYNCGPESGGLMSLDVGLGTWESLLSLTGDSGSIHITGGEPFMYYDHMAELVGRAHKDGLGGLDSIETNGYWATDRKVIVERMKYLDSVGMGRLKISCDPFHGEYVDSERVKLLARTAEEVLGKDRVLVRWEKYLQEPVSFSELSESSRHAMYVEAMKDFPCRFTGRGAGLCAELMADKRCEDFSSANCKSSFLSAKGVHVDPYGNVFSGLCSGIIVGNVQDVSLEDMWLGFDPENSDVIETLFASGPCGLLDSARGMGYEVRTKYASKCHLCSDIRRFFFDTGNNKQIIGPGDCYAPGK